MPPPRRACRTPATTLPHLDRIQASFGRHSIAHIQAHVGPEAARASRAMNALAYASGGRPPAGGRPGGCGGISPTECDGAAGAPQARRGGAIGVLTGRRASALQLARPRGGGALAYAHGTEIHVASGQERHLPHEAWHVQQKQGRVEPTLDVAGVAVNDDARLERGAEVVGRRAGG